MAEDRINKYEVGTVQSLEVIYHPPGHERGNILSLIGDVMPFAIQSENEIIDNIPKDYLSIRLYNPRKEKEENYLVYPVLDKKGDESSEMVCARLRIIKQKEE